MLRATANAGSDLVLHRKSLAEEIADLGVSELSARHSQVRRIIEHLPKMKNLPGPGPRGGWREAIVDARVEIELLLKRNPRPCSGLSSIGTAVHKRGARMFIARGLYRELTLALINRLRATTYKAKRALGDWFPPGLATELLIPMIASGATSARFVPIYAATYRSGRC